MHVRLFSMLAAGSLSLTLAACQATVSFPSAPLDAADRDVQPIAGVLAKPDGDGPFPAVVILHACGGVTQHINAGWLDYLVGIGYAALAVDTFGPRGHGRCPNPLWSASTFFVKDAYGALDYLAKQPFIDASRIAVMGFSIGADHINNALIPWRVRGPGGRDFKAAVAFYGQCRSIGPYPEGSIPLMKIIAEKDDYSGGCRYAAKQNPRIELRIIAGAYHAFDSPEYSGKTDPAGNRMLYSAEGTKTAREHTRAFLAKHLGKGR
jgi:dienelactone hydrolase